MRILRKFTILFYAAKSVGMVCIPAISQIISPNIYFSGVVIEYVKQFSYLGLFISAGSRDDLDIKKVIRVFMRGEILYFVSLLSPDG